MSSKNDYKAKNAKSFKLVLCLTLPGDVRTKFAVKDVTKKLSIRQLKINAELITGIPNNLQRLHYIDEGELYDDETLAAYDIVPNAQVVLKVWQMWESLVKAIIMGYTEEVFKLGVTPDSDFENPQLNYLNQSQDRQKYLAERANVALFIACHRGQLDLCSRLIKSGADVNWKTATTKRSPLHVAAALGHVNIVGLLLDNGADIKAEDAQGHTAIDLAKQFGHKTCERNMVQFTWQQRAQSSHRTVPPPPLLPHQRFDSALRAKLVDGEYAQVYRPQLVPPGEFGGTSLDAPRRKIKTPGCRRDHQRSDSRSSSSASASGANSQYVYYNYHAPSEWLALTAEVSDLRQATTTTKDGAAPSPVSAPRSRRPVTDDQGDLVYAVIMRKMREQQEKGLGGLPYDLWLATRDHTELYQALKDRGRLDSVLPESDNFLQEQ